MKAQLRFFEILLACSAAISPLTALAQTASSAERSSLEKIDTIVYIYAENRSFDNLYGAFPGANGLQNLTPEQMRQLDRDGRVLAELPPVWGGLTARGVTPAVTQEQTAHLPNKPFAIDDPKGLNLSLSVATHDLWHRFYQNQMQIDGGKNDKFVAWADSGGEVMGYYDGSSLPRWKTAQRYTLADNFFQGGFGGSFLNHFWIVCGCAPIYPDADKSPAKPSIAAVEDDGITLKVASDSPASAMGGIPKFVSDGNLTPDFYAVNTMQPPYQPSAIKPAPDGDPAYADPSKPVTLPPQDMTNIGDLMNAKGISWAYWSGAWQLTLDGKNALPTPNFQYHHQPFNYFRNMAPGTPNRADHIKDAGMNGVEFIKAIDAGRLPQVSIYKPQGDLNEHAGYADVLSGDEHLADVVAHLERSPQWGRMLVVITYDENGGFWDHVAPPKADRWGPGSRIPALIISPFAKKGFVDHALNDSASPIRFVIHRFGLSKLDGLEARDRALVASGNPPMGDLSEALDLGN
ncbi:MAG: acid phosphatase protein [Hyphomicrobiales bacterium]|nr:acid phosphatase protein [Hyphomicrobiales bacterium]